MSGSNHDTLRVPPCTTASMACYLWTATTLFFVVVVPLVHAFPDEVFDDKYQFTQAGDINLGAILSIHGKNRANDPKMPRDRYSNDATLTPETGTTSPTSGEDGTERLLNDQGVRAGDDEDDDNDDEDNYGYGVNGDADTTRKKSEKKYDSKSGSISKQTLLKGSSKPNGIDSPRTSSKISEPSMSLANAPPFNLTAISKSLGHERKSNDCSKSAEQQPSVQGNEEGREGFVDSVTKPAPLPASPPAKTPTTTATRTTTTTDTKRPASGQSEDRGGSSMFESTADRICSPDIANFQALENMVAILFALDEVNTRMDLLPGIELGITILDDCFTPVLARARAIQFMPGASDLQASTSSLKDPPHRRHQNRRSSQPISRGRRDQPLGLEDVEGRGREDEDKESPQHKQYRSQQHQQEYQTHQQPSNPSNPQRKRLPQQQQQQQQQHQQNPHQQQQKHQPLLSAPDAQHHTIHHIKQAQNTTTTTTTHTLYSSINESKHKNQQPQTQHQTNKITQQFTTSGKQTVNQTGLSGQIEIRRQTTPKPQKTTTASNTIIASHAAIKRFSSHFHNHQSRPNSITNSVDGPSSKQDAGLPPPPPPTNRQPQALSSPTYLFHSQNHYNNNNNNNENHSTQTDKRGNNNKVFRGEIMARGNLGSKNHYPLSQLQKTHNSSAERRGRRRRRRRTRMSKENENETEKEIYEGDETDIFGKKETMNVRNNLDGLTPERNVLVKAKLKPLDFQVSQQSEFETNKGRSRDVKLQNKNACNSSMCTERGNGNTVVLLAQKRDAILVKDQDKVLRRLVVSKRAKRSHSMDYDYHDDPQNATFEIISSSSSSPSSSMSSSLSSSSSSPSSSSISLTSSLSSSSSSSSPSSPSTPPPSSPLSSTPPPPSSPPQPLSPTTQPKSIHTDKQHKRPKQSKTPTSSLRHKIPPPFPQSTKTSKKTSSTTPLSLSRHPRDIFQNRLRSIRGQSPNHKLPRFYDVVGIVGAYTSSLSVEVADVMSIFNLPQISHAATTDILADKLKYPVFFRTVPADNYQIQTMAELLHHFRWKYVSIVFSADAYGMRAEKTLKSLLQDLDICVAQTVELNDSMALTDYENVIFNLRSHKNARVVVLYADIKHISPLMTAVRSKEAYQEFIWAGSDTTSLVSEMEEENCRHIIGSLSITMNSSAPPKFKEYLYKFFLKHQGILRQFAWKDPEKMYALFYEFSDVVRLKPFIDSKYFERPVDLKYNPTFTVSYAIDAVNAFAHAIQGFIKTNCPGARGEQATLCIQGRSIIPYLKSVNFQGTSGNVYFNEHGDVVGHIAISQCQMHEGVSKQVAVATWDAKAKKSLKFHAPLQWPNRSTSFPRSLCANACSANEIYVFPKQTCCWNCVKCKVNEISIRNKTSCRQCADLYWPDETSFLTCHKIRPSYIRMTDLLPLTLAIITTLGLMISFVTGFTFYTYRTERIIRSSSRELSSIMLVGVFFAFLLVLSLLSEPTVLKCYLNHVGFGMTFTLVYGPLLVKTNRIYRIFTTSRKSAALPKRTSSAWQLLFASGFVLVQVTIVTLSTIFAPPKVTESMPIKTDKYVIEYCDLALSGFLPSIAYNLALVLICTWYAFKTRRLPDNYNESRYIAFCVDTTVLVWISFIPTYFAMKRPYYKVVILALALLINSIVCLLLLFVPKMYLLYMSKTRPPNHSRGGGGGCGAGGGGGGAQPGDFHMQLMSNFSMSGLLRSSPSFYYGDNNGVLEEKTDSVQRPSASAATENQLSSIHEQDLTFVSSAAVLIAAANSHSDA